MENQVKQQKPFYKKPWVIIVGVLVVLFIIGALAGNDTKTENKAEGQSEAKTDTPEAAPSNWSYSEEEDQMTNKKMYFAQCLSTNEIDFEFPYNGGSKFTLTIRNKSKVNEVVLSVSKGQFMPGIMSSEYCRVKFDDGQTEKYTYNSADDGSADVIFLDQSSKFIAQLKNAKKIMIEAPFFEAGRKVIYFDVEGFSWNK